MSHPKQQIREALTVLNNYYGVLGKQLADEILAHKADFESPELERVEGLVERYAKHANRINVLYGILRFEAQFDKPEGGEPLARNQFRCFGCGEVIDERDQACPLCGWTWR